MLVLSASDVRRALPMRDAIDAMKGAFAALSDGRAEVPLRSRLLAPPHEGLTLLMPAFVNGPAADALAVKVVSLFPGNPARGIAYIQAAILVLEPQTGRAAAFLEGSSLTAIRTGAAGGAAVDILARPESSVLAVFGAGVQARTQAVAACTVRQIERVWIFDTKRKQAETLASELAGKAPVPQDLRVAATPQQAVADADVICTATTSLTPVFKDADVKKGTHISAIGSYTPDMQEIPGETVARARVVVDSRSAALAETGDLIKPIEAGLFAPERIYAELGEIVLGRKPGRESSGGITLFKSVGVAVQDAVAANLALENARKMGLGTELEL
jgi:ornithine cyclodeaminase/alanine dehydrogenase-like protein (mu-crystallin family)